MYLFLAFLVGAFGYRCRGGGLAGEEIKLFGHELPTSIRRLLWAVPVGMLLIPDHGFLGLVAMATLYLGVMPGYFGGGFDLFLIENRTVKNYAILTAKGASLCLPTAIVLSAITGQPTAFGGVILGCLFVPCYLIWAKVGNKYGNLGEILLGGLMALGLVL